MAATISFTQAELDAVGAKLEAIEDEFSDDERVLLSSLFVRGLQGVREDAGEDVVGFGHCANGRHFPAVSITMRKSGGDPGGAGKPFLQVQCDGSVIPTDQFSLNFSNIEY